MNVAEGLERYLSDQWGEAVRVEDTIVSTTGARRQNILFTAVTPQRKEGLVVTIIPVGLSQVMTVETETAVRTLAEQHGVAVPTVRNVCSDPSYFGAPFFISDRVDGETIPRQVVRLAQRSGIGAQIIRQLGASLARLHEISGATAASVLGEPLIERPIADGLAAMRTAIDDLLQPAPALSYGLRWLQEHAPAEPGRSVLIHADARVGNIIVGESGLRGLLDWEGARTGDPMEDPAWTCIRMWRFGNDAEIAGGLAGLDEYKAGYEEAGGAWDDQRLLWWRVFSTLRWAVGLSGQTAAHLDGSQRSIVMAGSGRRVPEMEYDLLLLTRPD